MTVYQKSSAQDGDDVSSTADTSIARETPPSSGTNTPTTLEQDHMHVFDPSEIEEAFQDHKIPEDNPHVGIDDGQGWCALAPERSAVWLESVTETKLSAFAAAVLLEAQIFSPRRLQLYPVRDQYPESSPTDPISGAFAAAHSTIGGVVMGVADYPIEVTKMVKSDRDVARNLAADFALDSGKGISRIVGTGLKAPMELTNNISKGFNNVPKLYGDDTVREDVKVTGLASGTQGFGLGLFDGITGLVTQPVRGAQKGGFGGFVAGLGKGLGGVVCKPAAGAVGLPAKLLKGVYAEVQNQRDSHIRATQLAQGQKEWHMSTEEQKIAVIEKWYATCAPPPKYE
ncbi:CHIP6 protein [Diplocarpon rosae]|nr:CHIP6 protein [Diplocarpon rosae]